ncbi:MAG: hypothetical protein MK066_02740 [Crocinitomicaceae bacterium]|nr:hypothetical protein [Crocinitomicaceae bacterium]
MNFLTLLEGLTYLSPILLLVGLLLGLYVFNRLDNGHKIILLYFGFSLSIDAISRLLSFYEQSNIFLLPLLAFFELIVFTFLYFRCLIGRFGIIDWGLVLVGLLFMIWEVSNLISIDIAQFQSYSKAVGSLVIVFLSVRYIVHVLNSEEDIKKDLLGLNNIILLFFAINLVIFLPINFLINEQSQLKFYFWMINLLMLLVFYGLLIRSVWKNGNRIQHLKS